MEEGPPNVIFGTLRAIASCLVMSLVELLDSAVVKLFAAGVCIFPQDKPSSQHLKFFRGDFDRNRRHFLALPTRWPLLVAWREQGNR